MAKITDGDLLNVGTELTINTTARTFTLTATGNLVAKDGVTLQALHSKFIKLWDDIASVYRKHPLPTDFSLFMVANQPKGIYQFVWGWKPANDATRKMLRDGWWEERSSAWVLNRVYTGVVSRGDVSTWSQLYYQLDSADAPTNFTYTDEINEAVQVYGDASNGNFDKRAYFKAFVREYGYKYDDSILADTGLSGTWPYIIDMLLQNEADPKIIANDATVSSTLPYTGITVTYYNTDQNRNIWGTNYPFRIIVNGNNATLEQIYTKLQYLLRQNSDIDSGAGTVNGKTASLLLTMLGDSGTTGTWVYIDNFNSNDTNRITFTDKNWVARVFPFVAAGTLLFDSLLSSGGTGHYSMYFVDLPWSFDYPSDTAVVVNDASGTPITGTITGSSISFTYDYDGNVQGWRAPWTDANVAVVASNAWVSYHSVTYYTIAKLVGQNISVQWKADPIFIP